jgi:hypothetical protein
MLSPALGLRGQSPLCAGNDDAPFSQVFDSPVAQVEPAAEPDGARNNIGRESVEFVSIHGPSGAISIANLSVAQARLLARTSSPMLLQTR